MNSAIFGFVVLVAAVSPVSDQANGYIGQAISGFATHALLNAYRASGLDGATPAPFSLQPYVVSIQAGEGYFLVSFIGQNTTEHRDVIVKGSTAKFLATRQSTEQPDDLTPPTEEFVLPGVVGGEIIAVYQRAISDGSISNVATSNAYNLDFHVGAGMAVVGFTVRDAPQVSITLKPEPTPTPKPDAMRCLSGPCGRVAYIISVLNRRVTIQPSVML